MERCRFSEMDLGLGGEDLGMAEWLHFMLLRVFWQQKKGGQKGGGKRGRLGWVGLSVKPPESDQQNGEFARLIEW